MIPLYGFLEHDTIGLLVMAYPTDTMADLITKVQQSASIRIKSKKNMCLKYKDKIRHLESTVADLQFQPLDHFFVISGGQC